MTIRLTKEEAQNYLVAYHHLSDKYPITSEDELLQYIRKVGCIQFDPIDVAGRNADLVIQSRWLKYQKEMLSKLLYEDRSLTDLWDKNMSICPVEDWPYFKRFRQHVQPRCEQYKKGIEVAQKYLREHEYCCAEDLGLKETGDTYFAPRTLGKAALEYMCYAGLAAVHHKEGTRRYYCLAERAIPPAILNAPDPNQTDEAFWAWLVLRRINSIGLLWNRGGDAWLGIVDFKSEQRKLGFSALLAEGQITPIEITGVSHTFYIDTRNLPFLEEVRGGPSGGNLAFLAPLDNFLWDRQLILCLFGFDYRWEVYTPAVKRKYSYYVLPILWGSRLVGRIELTVDKLKGGQNLPVERILVLKSIWWEDGVRQTAALKTALRKRMRAFAKFNNCQTIDYNNLF